MAGLQRRGGDKRLEGKKFSRRPQRIELGLWLSRGEI